MKNKVLILIAGCAIITFSFTYSSNEKQMEAKSDQSTSVSAEPIGGLVSETF